jgi:hypothetical protein
MTFGPVTWQELKQMASTGELLPSDVVGPIGMARTVRAGKVAGLFGEEGEDHPFNASGVVAHVGDPIPLSVES